VLGGSLITIMWPFVREWTARPGSMSFAGSPAQAADLHVQGATDTARALREARPLMRQPADRVPALTGAAPAGPRRYVSTSNRLSGRPDGLRTLSHPWPRMAKPGGPGSRGQSGHEHQPCRGTSVCDQPGMGGRDAARQAGGCASARPVAAGLTAGKGFRAAAH